MPDQADPFSTRLELASAKQSNLRSAYFESRDRFLGDVTTLSIVLSVLIVCVLAVILTYPVLGIQRLDPAGSLLTEQSKQMSIWLSVLLIAGWVTLNFLPVVFESISDSWTGLHLVLRWRSEYLEAKKTYVEARKEFIRSFKPKEVNFK